MSDAAHSGSERRKVGRPSNPEPMEVLHVRVTIATIDRLCKLAMRADKPASVVARLLLERELSRMEALMNQP